MNGTQEQLTLIREALHAILEALDRIRYAQPERTGSAVDRLQDCLEKLERERDD